MLVSIVSYRGVNAHLAGAPCIGAFSVTAIVKPMDRSTALISTLTTPTFGILDDVRALVLAVLSPSVVSRLLHAAPAAARRAAGLRRIC